MKKFRSRLDNMTFRADESEQNGLEQVLSYLLGINIEAIDRLRGKEFILDVVERYGPPVDSYPLWHPLVSHSREPKDSRETVVIPEERCGYDGLDHTVYFRNAFITCPYGSVDKVLESVDNMPTHPVFCINAKVLNIKLYHPTACPVLVTCEWKKPSGVDRMIPASLAIPLLLEKELPAWRSSQVAETWETMRTYFLGKPCGKRSSLFVSQETGLAMKKIWNSLIYSGMYGPIKIR